LEEQDIAIFRQVSAHEILGAQNFNFPLNFPEMVDFLAPNFSLFLEEYFPTKRLLTG